MSDILRLQASEILSPAAYMAVRITRCLRETTERRSARTSSRLRTSGRRLSRFGGSIRSTLKGRPSVTS